MRVEHGKVLVTLTLRENLPLHRDCKISVQPSSVLGGRYIAIIPGSESEPLVPLDEIIQGLPSVDFIGEAAEAVKAVRKALESGGVLDNLEETMSNLRNITDDIDAGKGTIGKLVKDEELYNSIRDITAKINDGQGTLGKLVNDDTVYQDLQKIADDLKDVSGRLAAGKGTIGKLLSEDDAFYNDLSAAAKGFREMGENISKGEGTLGRLAKDDELYEQATKLFEELRATIDDIRETSPVTSFTSVFFGAF
jgi:phospholipid/cholesterol/gamma-HCH transport system substrate-binding protein